MVRGPLQHPIVEKKASHLQQREWLKIDPGDDGVEAIIDNSTVQHLVVKVAKRKRDWGRGEVRALHVTQPSPISERNGIPNFHVVNLRGMKESKGRKDRTLMERICAEARAYCADESLLITILFLPGNSGFAKVRFGVVI
jgi:hypothetical protein